MEYFIEIRKFYADYSCQMELQIGNADTSLACIVMLKCVMVIQLEEVNHLI